MEDNKNFNAKDYINSFLASILSETNSEFLIKFDKIIMEKYEVNFNFEDDEFKFMVNRIANNNQERGELCSSTLKKVNKYRLF